MQGGLHTNLICVSLYLEVNNLAIFHSLHLFLIATPTEDPGGRCVIYSNHLACLVV